MKSRLTLGFCDREWIEDYKGFWDASRVISITDPGSEPAKIAMPEQQICRLQFHDIIPEHLKLIGDGEIEGKKPILFTDVMASVAVTFVVSHLDTMAALMIHCEAGISRSPGMAEAFKHVLTPLKDIIWFPRRSVPNKHVFDLTLNAWKILNDTRRVHS